MSDAVFWQMVEAIGTISAFILAFYFGLSGKFNSFRNRPKVELDFKEEENYIVRDEIKKIFEIRLKIINNGLTTAIKTNVKLDSIIQNQKNVLTKNPHENFFKLDISDENLQNKEYKFFNLITIGRAVRNGKKLIELYAKTSQWIEECDTIFNISITGDNFPAFTKSFKYEHNEDLRKSKFYEITRKKGY